jgi:hypothetical protein
MPALPISISEASKSVIELATLVVSLKKGESTAMTSAGMLTT